MSSQERLAAAVLRGGGIGYDTVRSLHSHGIDTYLLTAKRLRDGKYPGATILTCPSHDTPEGAEALVTFLNTRLAPGRDVVLLPTSDDGALFLASRRNQLDKRFRYLTSDASLVEAMDNKMLFYELCEKHGIAYPKTWIIRNQAELECALAQVSAPSIVKPFRSRLWPESIGYKVIVARSVGELRTLLPRALAAGCEIIVQEMIPGGPETIVFLGGLYDQNSHPVKLYVGRKLLQYPLDIGSTCFATLSWNQDVADMTNVFMKRIGYQGLIDMEFKYDSRDGTYKIIEVNPRNGLWHRISDNGRWDITSYYVHWLCGDEGTVRDYRPHEDGRRWVFPHAHLCSCVETDGLLRGLGSWCREVCGTRLRCGWDIWDLRRDWSNARSVFAHVRRLGWRHSASRSRRRSI